MPFKPIKGEPGEYKSPSGRKFNTAQVKLYYATGGSFDKKDIPKHEHHKETLKKAGFKT